MNSDFRDLLSALNDKKAEYLIVGGYAVMEYTEPRYTKDLDVWIWASPENAHRVYEALANFGAPLEGMSPKDFEAEGYVFQIGIAPVRVDILMSVSGLTFEAAWERRFASELDGVSCWLISRDDLIKNKRASGRPQDLIDADNLEKLN